MSKSTVYGIVMSVGVVIITAIMAFGAGRNHGNGLALGHNKVPVDTVMEIHAVSHLGLPDTAYVLASPFNSNKNPKFYQLEVSVPDRARCFTTSLWRGSSDGYNNIRFLNCPTTAEAWPATPITVTETTTETRIQGK